MERLCADHSSYYTIVRPYITYDDHRIPLGIAPAYNNHKTIIERIRSGKPMFVWDDGKAITTVTHTEDFAKALVGLFLNGKAKNEAFHITGDFRYTGKGVLLTLYKILGCSPNIFSVSSDNLIRLMPRYANMLKGDRALDAVFDNSKIKKAVPDLEFKIDLHEGLRRIVAYYDEMNSPKYDYEFDAQMDRVAYYYGFHTDYVSYAGLSRSQRLKYVLFKRCPYKIAKRINRIL